MTVPAKRIGRYTVVNEIARGGFGRTILAETSNRKRVVIKQFSPQQYNIGSQALRLFDQECIRLQELGHHEQIPSFVEYFEERGSRYIVQEFVNGQNLKDELEQYGTFSESQIIALLRDILPVIKFVHDMKVIHRDIKPENIIRRFSDDKLFLVDFGASKPISETVLALTGTMIGSPLFVAPEQSRGKATYASDIYGLGLTCAFMLTNISPFDLVDEDEGKWVWQNYCTEGISEDLSLIISKMLSRGLKSRYKSAFDVLEDIIFMTDRRKNLQDKSQIIFSSISLEKFHFKVVRVNHKAKVINRTKEQAQLFKENLGSGIYLEMVLIPGGTFEMGAPSYEPGAMNFEMPQHEVTVPSFCFGRYPVTQGQWIQLMGANPSSFKGAKRPVESILWHEAVEFCHRISTKTGRHYRLPSEAEWEYACRAGTQTSYHYGEKISRRLANFNTIFTTCPRTKNVNKFSPNAFGLHGMHGNIYEWCLDTFHSGYEGAPTDGSPWVDSNNGSHIMRGGSWFIFRNYCRSASRSHAGSGFFANVSSDNYGFRVVCSIPISTSK